MKGYARAFGLRQAGRHRAMARTDLVWMRDHGVAQRIANAFQLNCMPRHLKREDWDRDMCTLDWCPECGAVAPQHVSDCINNPWRIPLLIERILRQQLGIQL